MRRRRPAVVLAIGVGLLLLALGPAGQASVPASDPVVGAWTWKFAPPGEALATRGSVTFSTNGTMSWSGGNSGTWSRSGSSVTLNWVGSTKSVDTMTLSADNRTMTGSNNAGWSVQGVKQSGGDPTPQSCAAPPRLPASTGMKAAACDYVVRFSFRQRYVPFRFGKDVSLPDRVTTIGQGKFVLRDWDPRQAGRKCVSEFDANRMDLEVAHNHDELVAGKPRPTVETTAIGLEWVLGRFPVVCVQIYRGPAQKVRAIQITMVLKVVVSNDPRCPEGDAGGVNLRAGDPFARVVTNICGHRHVYAPQNTLAKQPQKRVDVRIDIDPA